MQDDYPLPDDEAAEEALAAQQLRDESDAALSNAQDALNQAGQKWPVEDNALDPHAEERAALGFDLAWWADEGEHNTPALDIVVDLTNRACGRTHYLEALEKLGLDLSSTTGYVGLNSKTSPLVVAGLQILGTLHSHIRAEVAAVLKQIFDAVPDPTEEFEAECERVAVIHEEQKLREFAESMGVRVMTPDEFAEQIVTQDDQRRDARNN